MSNQTIKNKALDFVKYHNGFVLGLVLALFGGAAIFAASPEARGAVLGQEIITQTGIDNAALLNADLENFNFNMKVDNVTEDETNYYADYSFLTLAVKDGIWQPASRAARIIVAKASLSGKDLGLYVQAQLANIAQNELAYLKLAQNAEREKGTTQIVKTTDYTGLIGLVLDVKNAVLPGYDPVIKPEPVKLARETSQEPEMTREPELLQESEQIKNATTTREIVPGGSQDQAGNTESQTPESQHQPTEIGNENAAITAEKQTESAPAETEAETEPSLSVDSEVLMPDIAATTTAEQ